MRNVYVAALPIVMASVSAMMAIDLYLPAIPSLPGALNGTAAEAQYSVGAFLATFALGQLVFGVLGDRTDRRKILLLALAGLVVTSLLCAMATTMWQLIGLRLLQGFAASAGAALGPPILRELAGGMAVVRLMGVVGSIQSLVPAFAPAIGAWMLKYVGWEALFLVVAVMAGITMAMFSFMPPPKRAERQRPLGHPLAGYGALLRSKQYLGYSLSHAFAMGGLITFIMSAPYVITAHTSGSVDDFAVMMIVLVACFVVSANTAAPIVRRIGADTTIVVGSVLQAIGGIAFLTVCLTMSTPTVTAITLSMMPINFGLGLRGGAGFARVMDLMPQHTGSASALLIFLSAGIGSIGTPLVAPFLPLGAASLGLVVAVQVIVSLAILPLAIRTLSNPARS